MKVGGGKYDIKKIVYNYQQNKSCLYIVGPFFFFFLGAKIQTSLKGGRNNHKIRPLGLLNINQGRSCYNKVNY